MYLHGYIKRAVFKYVISFSFLLKTENTIGLIRGKQYLQFGQRVVLRLATTDPLILPDLTGLKRISAIYDTLIETSYLIINQD